MTTTRTVLRGKDTADDGDLYMSFELGDKQWQISIGNGQRHVSRYTVGAGDTSAVADCIVKAAARLRTGGQAQVHSCYEAGRDGWWLHRWLSELGVDNIVVDAASIEVNRRARRAKTDRLEREGARLKLVKEQVRAVEAARCKELAEGKQPLVARLARLRAIGPKGAWILVKEVFGWRHFANRRELAGSLGLVPTPYASGDSEIEQGISKAGNRRARGLLVELAWGWLRLQPGSALTRWFNRRFAGAGKRMRRVGIVALARRLAIALWRYLQDGEIPAGAHLKPATAHA